MSSNVRLSWAVISLFLIYFSCQGPQKTKREKISMEELDSLRTVYYDLQDSIRDSWEAMIGDDDQKIADMKRVLDEVRYTQNFDSAKMDSLTRAISNLKDLRYNQNSMAKSGKIDRYDSATLAVTDSILQFVKEHPKYDNYPFMEKLTDDISDANQKVLLYRIKYDRFAKQYNQFIEEHKPIIEEIDTSKDKINKKPLFQIGPS